MIQDIYPKIFDNQYKDVVPKKDSFLMVFRGHGKKDDEILVAQNDKEISLPKVGEIPCEEEKLTYLFSIDEQSFFLYISDDMTEGISLPENCPFSYQPTRLLRRNDPVDVCFAGMTAYHLFVWYRNTRFCGHCGGPAVHDKKLRMMKCPACGNMMFPMIAPAVIIGLRHDDSILISTYAGREYKGRALLAGFCEIGETPEETVAREVLEEVGLKVKNIEYFGSQPWGFDSNLLLGYFCDVDGEIDIKMDEEELASARFIKRDQIEEDPNLLSLTATMIEQFRLGKK